MAEEPVAGSQVTTPTVLLKSYVCYTEPAVAAGKRSKIQVVGARRIRGTLRDRWLGGRLLGHCGMCWQVRNLHSNRWLGGRLLGHCGMCWKVGCLFIVNNALIVMHLLG